MSELELQPGHTLAVVKSNAAKVARTGKSQEQAYAVAFRHARQSLRRRLNDGVEVFRAGNYPGKIPVTETDVSRIADTYNRFQAGRGTRYEAAAKQTHESGKPALGWVSKLEAKGKSLIAQFRDTSDELLNGIIEERYPNPSIELRQSFQVGGKDQGLSLKAVALLGADPPAVKEVEAFSEDSDGEMVIAFSFEEWNSQPGGTMNDNDKPGATSTLKIQVEPVAPAKDDTASQQFSEADLKAAEDRARKDTEAKVRAEMEAKFAEEKAQEAEKARLDGNLEFCEGLVKAGKLQPSDRDFTLKLLNALTPDLNFGEGKAAKPLADELKERLSAAPKSALFGVLTPVGDKGLPPEETSFTEGSEEHAEYLSKLADEHKISFGEAVRVDLISRNQKISISDAMRKAGIKAGAKGDQ
jgi:hypothetical protein